MNSIINQLTGNCKKCGNPYFGNNVNISYSGQLCRCVEPEIEQEYSQINNNMTQPKIGMK